MLLKIRLNLSISLIRSFSKPTALYFWEGDALARASTSLSRGFIEIIKLMQPFIFHTNWFIMCTLPYYWRFLIPLWGWSYFSFFDTIYSLVKQRGCLWSLQLFVILVAFKNCFNWFRQLSNCDKYCCLWVTFSHYGFSTGEMWWHECECVNPKIRPKIWIILQELMQNDV